MAFGSHPFEFDPVARADTWGWPRFAGLPSYLPDAHEMGVRYGTHAAPLPHLGNRPDAVYSRLGQIPDLSSWLPATWPQWIVPAALGIAFASLICWQTAGE